MGTSVFSSLYCEAVVIRLWAPTARLLLLLTYHIRQAISESRRSNSILCIDLLEKALRASILCAWSFEVCVGEYFRCQNLGIRSRTRTDMHFQSIIVGSQFPKIWKCPGS